MTPFPTEKNVPISLENVLTIYIPSTSSTHTITTKTIHGISIMKILISYELNNAEEFFYLGANESDLPFSPMRSI